MARRGVTLRALIEEGLEHVVAESAPAGFELRDARFRGRTGFARGAGEQDIATAIREFNEGERGP